jgi:hypothetical protein
MPSYYFNIKGYGEFVESDTPVHFPNLAAAKDDGLTIIRGMLADLPGEFQLGTLGYIFEICNEAGEVLDIIRFSDAVLLH